MINKNAFWLIICVNKQKIVLELLSCDAPRVMGF